MVILREGEQIVNQSTSVADSQLTLTVMKVFSGQILLTRYIDDIEVGCVLLTTDDIRALGECEIIAECF